MEPVTINLDGLAELGPFVYMLVHSLAGTLFGLVSWRSIKATGKCFGNRGHEFDAEGNAHVAVAIVSGAIGVANIIMLMVMSWQMFDKAI